MLDERESQRHDLIRFVPQESALEELNLEEFSVMELEDRLEFGLCNDNCSCSPTNTNCSCNPNDGCTTNTACGPEPDSNCENQSNTICI